MFRRILASGAGTLALLCVVGLPGQLYAQRMHGGFRPGFTPNMGRMRPNFDRRFIDPRMGTFTPGFDRRFINPRLNGALPGFDRRLINPRLGGFNPALERRFIDSRAGVLTPGLNRQLMGLQLQRQILALHMGLF